ncbi:MAG: NAD(P)H-dependent oxidoreductase subunit E [Planctomycetes bacterium]|nr:NAD(P)H-dependent oxidoreductase subunit E [Planctomycetota bacterium]
MAKFLTPEDLEQFRRTLLSQRDAKKPCVSVCTGTACLANSAAEVMEAVSSETARKGLAASVDVRSTGCHGFCERGPVVVVNPEETCYLGVSPKDATEILSQTIENGKVVDRLLYANPVTGEKTAVESDIPFYKGQTRTLLSSNLRIDPKSLDDYVSIGGYSALSKALSRLTPEQVIDTVKKSKIRGRGGAGFPTGIKWEGSRQAPGEIKYVIVNADEGDPGASMDRTLMEGNPHSILEGLIIGGYAVGAQEGYVYVRQEYPLAVENILLAIEQAEAHGLLGRNILGSGFDFAVKVHRGGGAFVCGESTALMTALEGRAGEPRPKYVRSNVRGLWNRPSVLNNVETWANIPLIVNNGADWFTRIGTENSTGTKIFSLVGKIAHTGLVEVPMGISLRDIIFKIGGGIPGGKKFKAVQTGGPSGGCLPENLLDLGVDFDELEKAGSMMGSGGMIVMDEDTCMVDVARYFVHFLTDESCGKCVPCREGLRQMDRILTRITEGQGKEGDLEILEDLSVVLEEASLCALGKSAPNPFRSTLRYFRHEYEAHIREKRCPALFCKKLVSFYIEPDKCRACMICMKKCPVHAIDGAKRKIHIIDQNTCNHCGTCLEVCPARFDAVRAISGRPVPPPIAEERRMVAIMGKES